MIRVNLLPEEYRKAEATPLKQYLAMIGATSLAGVSLAFLAYVHFVELPAKQQELAQIEKEVEQQKDPDPSKGLLTYVRALDKELKEYQSRVTTINTKARERLMWSRKVDEVWEILVNPRIPGRYEVWITTLACNLTGGGSGPLGGATRFAGYSAGETFVRLSEFHEDIERSGFFKDYRAMTQPGGAVTKLPGTDRVPAQGWTFDFSLGLKKLTKLYEDREAAAAKAAEQQGGTGPPGPPK